MKLNWNPDSIKHAIQQSLPPNRKSLHAHLSYRNPDR